MKREETLALAAKLNLNLPTKLSDHGLEIIKPEIEAMARERGLLLKQERATTVIGRRTSVTEIAVTEEPVVFERIRPDGTVEVRTFGPGTTIFETEEQEPIISERVTHQLRLPRPEPVSYPIGHCDITLQRVVLRFIPVATRKFLDIPQYSFSQESKVKDPRGNWVLANALERVQQEYPPEEGWQVRGNHYRSVRS